MSKRDRMRERFADLVSTWREMSSAEDFEWLLEELAYTDLAFVHALLLGTNQDASDDPDDWFDLAWPRAEPTE